MLYPTIFGENLFDELLDFPTAALREFPDVNRKLYGRHAAQLMRTDVHEKEDCFEIDVDLPGFKKDEIRLDLQNGNLTVGAAKSLDHEQKTEKGKLIRQERYSGALQRSFYVGKYVAAEEIKAKFEDGVLRLTVPKKDAPKLPEKKTILIEG